MNVPARNASCSCYYDAEPVLTEKDGTKHWVSRAANFVVVTSKVIPGSVLARDNEDEYFLLLPAGTSAVIDASGESLKTAGDSLTIVPPGDSQIQAKADGYVYRIFSNRATDLLDMADNAAAYAEETSDVAPLVDWPMPVGGFKLRHYTLADYVRDDTTMRLFRSSNLMVNVFLPSAQPRPLNKMSPHSHSDFEQGSLAIAGTYVHHMRYPWTADKTAWRADEHLEVHSPSLLIIPSTVIHTSQSMAVGANLVDIFAPPRADFSLRPGMVCNEDEYPLPESLQAQMDSLTESVE
jgi:hypothetical protein